MTPKLKDHATKNALCLNWKLEVGVDSTGQLVVKRGKQHETEQTNLEKAGVTLKINSKNAKGSGILETIRNFFWKDETANHRNQRTQSFWNKSEMRKLIWLLFEFAISKQHNFGHPLNFSKRRNWIHHCSKGSIQLVSVSFSRRREKKGWGHKKKKRDFKTKLAK